MKTLYHTLLWLTIFSIAMGFLESAVVVYLRQLYYPSGFKFPLTPIPNTVAVVEFLREFATLIMLISIGVLSGRNITQRFAFFIFCFATWDIFYYVFLKLLVNWPQSMFDWDILFLIPVLWVGPVISPCIVALTMIAFTFAVVYFHQKKKSAHISLPQWILLIIGAILLMITFMQNYVQYMSQQGRSLWTPESQQQLFDDLSHYIPTTFDWTLFWIGEILIILSLILYILKNNKVNFNPAEEVKS
jgi:hypothetical protein